MSGFLPTNTGTYLLLSVHRGLSMKLSTVVVLYGYSCQMDTAQLIIKINMLFQFI